MWKMYWWYGSEWYQCIDEVYDTDSLEAGLGVRVALEPPGWGERSDMVGRGRARLLGSWLGVVDGKWHIVGGRTS